MLKPLSLIFLLAATPALAQLQTSVSGGTLPSLGGLDPDATTCRPPQHRSDSQLMGPKVCMTNKQWADLRQSGYEIGPDGVKVPIQKNMDLLTH